MNPSSPICFTVTPLDVIKIRLQAQKTPLAKGKKKTKQKQNKFLICARLSLSSPNLLSRADSRIIQFSFCATGKCFVYCNGLMDHLCVCENGSVKAWYKPRGHFNSTLVRLDCRTELIWSFEMAVVWYLWSCNVLWYRMRSSRSYARKGSSRCGVASHQHC